MNNLLPFTIEAYERGEEVVYRNGEKPDEIHWFKTAKSSFPILTCFKGEIHGHHPEGIKGSGITPDYDLFIKPKTVEKYRYEYKNGADRWYDLLIEAHQNRRLSEKRIGISRGTFSGNELIDIEIVKP